MPFSDRNIFWTIKSQLKLDDTRIKLVNDPFINYNLILLYFVIVIIIYLQHMYKDIILN